MDRNKLKNMMPSNSGKFAVDMTKRELVAAMVLEGVIGKFVDTDADTNAISIVCIVQADSLLKHLESDPDKILADLASLSPNDNDGTIRATSGDVD